MENEITLKRFIEIRRDLGYTQAEFVVVELFKQFKVNPLWLFGESENKNLATSNTSVIPKVVTVDSSEQENMVLVNAKAAAGYPQNIQDTSWYKELPAFDLPLPEFRNATYRGFQVEGDSRKPNSNNVTLVSLNEAYPPYEIKPFQIQEIWQVNSKITFGVDATTETGLLKQLQESMEELKSQFKRQQAS